MAPPCGKGKKPPCEIENPSNQQVPYGVTRVRGIANYSGDNVAWIIDSGIDINHPDLNVDESRGFRGPQVAPFVLEHPFDDDHGHGTHVAGTIAAINNDFGVIGVAPGATVIPVKVLGENGFGWWTDVIAGVDYVAAHAKAGDVVNMSIGGGVTQALDDAVLAASERGIWFSIAAGNNADDANLYSPARANGEFIITVSAIDEFDNWASFSNYGNPPLDYAAPGVLVLSTYPNEKYMYMSGTSMAAPHAAGVILIGGSPNTNGTFVNGDPDETPDPIIAADTNLSATGYKVKGVWHTDLSWNYSGTVDIYRDGEILATIAGSSGTYTDVTGFKGRGSLSYLICEAGGQANCSNEVSVTF